MPETDGDISFNSTASFVTSKKLARPTGLVVLMFSHGGRHAVIPSLHNLACCFSPLPSQLQPLRRFLVVPLT